MILLIASIGVLILGIIVFGGGQVFMPLFKSLWEFMGHHGANISETDIDNIFTIANSTPGVVSTKLALFTGYLSANGAWWGWLALFLTYLIFSIPSILIMWFGVKLLKKSKSSKYLSNIIIYLRPIIVGIILALMIQLFIATAFPQVALNTTNNYLGIRTTQKSSFFTGWRFYALVPYVCLTIIETYFLYGKRKMNLFFLIVMHIIIGMILFEPWL